MTGDADPDARPQLRLVSGTGPDPLLDDQAEIEDLGGEPLELVLGEVPGGDLEFLLVPLLTEAERQMRSIRRPLDAEMWASELLGMLELGAPEDSTRDERATVTLNLATRLADHAMDQESLSGLAILRTLSVIGPPESRVLAREGASLMLESGLRDRAWAPMVGRPEVERSWRFRDLAGDQESVTVVFRYGKREHTLTALIDHALGGGVKDCWVGEDPDAALAETRAALQPEGIEVDFISIEQATLALSSALTRPECPAAPDEVEDIAMTRALLQSRVELLAERPVG